MSIDWFWMIFEWFWIKQEIMPCAQENRSNPTESKAEAFRFPCCCSGWNIPTRRHLSGAGKKENKHVFIISGKTTHDLPNVKFGHCSKLTSSLMLQSSGPKCFCIWILLYGLPPTLVRCHNVQPWWTMPCQPDHERNSAAWYSTIAVENPNVMQIHSHGFGDETSFQWLLRPLMIFGRAPQPPAIHVQEFSLNPQFSCIKNSWWIHHFPMVQLDSTTMDFPGETRVIHRFFPGFSAFLVLKMA